MKKFKGIEVWRWFNFRWGKQFGYSVAFCSFFLKWEYPLYNYSVSKNMFSFSYSPCEAYDHPRRGYYYEGKRLFLQIMALTLVNAVLFKKEVKFDCEDIY